MIGFESQEANASSIGSWSRQQCNEYLGKYPKGLKAEQVKKRLEVLNNSSGSTRDMSAPVKKRYTSKSSASSHSASSRQQSSTGGRVNNVDHQSGSHGSSSDSSQFKTYFLKFLTFVVIAAICVGIGSTVPIIGIPTSLAGYAIYRAIWHS